ncbi:MAG: 2-oxoglutarate dehydrogenase complex dihydrolipoyllysine-residue succinyltransferase [Bacteroidota bacterium]
MSLEIKVPQVGESITEVTLASWVKKNGDYVEMDEIICELESDKATFELNAEAAGVLSIKAEEGDTLEIGQLIAEIDTDSSQNGSGSSSGGDSSESPKEEFGGDSSSEAKPTGEVLEMKIPSVGESITEVTIGSWLKKDGDFVEMDEEIAEIETDKATQEFPAEAQGILRLVASEGDVVEVGAVIAKIEVMEGKPSSNGSSEEKATSEDASAGTQTSESKETYATGHASPAASKILSEKGVSSADVQGTGRDGRITKEDAANAQVKSVAKETQTSRSQVQTPAIPVQPGSRNSNREKMTNLRKTISRRLVAVKNETAMLTTFNEVNMKPIMDIRKKYKESFKEKYEVGLGFMSFFTKAVCVALKEWPSVNGMIDENELVYYDYCDVSIAVSTPKGLVTPVVRNAEGLGFHQIESEIIRLATKARDGKLSIDEMTGGTFTITNGGIFGSMLSTPIINPPQSAILGMHNIVERPMAQNGEVVVLPIMYVALSYDHRIVDGRESVSFLVRVKELLEDPSRLLLEV